MPIKFGPAGMGGINEAVFNLEKYNKLGLKACEIPFTYGVFIKKDRHKKEIEEIKKTAEKSGIQLSIHAPYWINLNSEDDKKIEDLIGAKRIVFHPGFYGKKSPEETYQKIKKEIIKIQKEIKKNKWHVTLCPETTGKENVFGKEDEILRLVEDTNCFFTIDFAHLWARNQGKKDYREFYEKVKHFKKLHCHFSGIEHGKKGEKRHILTSEKAIKSLLKIFPKNKDITIINESPDPVGDSVKSLKIWKSLNKK
jgi:deoxyribonuclease-4